MAKWKTIPTHPNYQASNDGKIRYIKTGNILEGGYNRRYLRAKVDGKGLDIHRLVAAAWIPNPENKPQVNHINGNKHDNRIENLEWVTAYENNLHARVTGLSTGPKKGEQNNCAKLTDDTIRYIKSIHKPFHKEFGTRALAKRFGVNDCWLSSILNNNRKRKVEWAKL